MYAGKLVFDAEQRIVAGNALIQRGKSWLPRYLDAPTWCYYNSNNSTEVAVD
jgi:hypothetical protein